MKITKYEHACLVAEIGGRTAVIDLGEFSSSFTPSGNIDAVIITHEHSDHFDPSQIAAIREHSPNATIFATATVAEQIDGASVPPVGEKLQVGNFTLEFFGHDHAAIIDGVVPCDNFGVVVNGELVYAGDSFTLPPLENPAILALPVSAPWLKVAESLDYLRKVQPARVFPTHDALLSEIGRRITYSWLTKTAGEIGAEFVNLQVGQSLEV